MKIRNPVDNSYDILAEKYPDNDTVILNDVGALYYDNNTVDSIAWINESPDILEYYAQSMFKAPFYHNLFHRMEVGIQESGHHFKRLYTHDKRFSKFERARIIKPATPSWISDEDSRVYKKTKSLSYISSDKSYTPLQIKRCEVAKEIQKYNIPTFGRGHNEVDSKLEALSEFRFSLVIENGIYAGYHTEKILDCFRTGTVPIYCGDPDIGDVFDMEGIIRFDINKVQTLYPIYESLFTEKLYKSMLPAIENNFELAMNYKNKPEDIMDEILENEKNES